MGLRFEPESFKEQDSKVESTIPVSLTVPGGVPGVVGIKAKKILCRRYLSPHSKPDLEVSKKQVQLLLQCSNWVCIKQRGEALSSACGKASHMLMGFKEGIQVCQVDRKGLTARGKVRCKGKESNNAGYGSIKMQGVGEEEERQETGRGVG